MSFETVVNSSNDLISNFSNIIFKTLSGKSIKSGSCIVYNSTDVSFSKTFITSFDSCVSATNKAFLKLIV